MSIWENTDKHTETLIEWSKKQQGKKIDKKTIFNKEIEGTNGLNLNKLGNIHQHISRIVKKKQDELPILCDRKCKEDKKKEELYRKYVLAKKNYQTAPKEYEEARKNFYVFR